MYVECNVSIWDLLFRPIEIKNDSILVEIIVVELSTIIDTNLSCSEIISDISSDQSQFLLFSSF